jgi:predicted amidohydrolase
MVQMSSAPGDVEGNLRKIVSFAEEAKGSDLICFPELSLTGYGAPVHAVRTDDAAIRGISAAAAEHGIAIAFGFAEKSDDKVYISHGLACGDGTLTVHRKTHLGKKEREHFAPGNEFGVVCTEKANIGFQICIESHFPEISTCLTYRGAELILMPFALPMEIGQRMSIWKKYLPARAYDNGVFVAACNCLKDGRGGGAMILDPRGNILAEDGCGRESMLTADLRGSMADRVPIDERKSMKGMDFFGSRRPELYSDVTRSLRR